MSSLHNEFQGIRGAIRRALRGHMRCTCSAMRNRTAALWVASACSFALASTSPALAQTAPVVVTGEAPVTLPLVPPPQSGYAVPPGYVLAPAPGYGSAYAPGYAPAYPQTQQIYASPRVIYDWSEGEPIPPGYHESTRIRRGLVIGGAVLFGSTYLLTALVGAALSDCHCTTTSFGPLLVPGVGPFIEMAQSGTASGSLFLALDGLSQLGGIAMFIAGFAAPKTVLVQGAVGSKGGLQLAFSPIVAPGQSGMGVVGSF
jgi:hypothetical protein